VCRIPRQRVPRNLNHQQPSMFTAIALVSSHLALDVLPSRSRYTDSCIHQSTPEAQVAASNQTVTLLVIIQHKCKILPQVPHLLRKLPHHIAGVTDSEVAGKYLKSHLSRTYNRCGNPELVYQTHRTFIHSEHISNNFV
jgi:hypothetical protein